jgi:glycosyltransferase involved in cell wall biosynthesis
MRAVHVTVIATVYNERATIDRLLDSLAAQTRPPDEVVICDGGSSDGTAAWMRAYAERHPGRLPNLRVIEAPGANIARGRNLAIEAATGSIIAVTDAGVRLASNWLEQLVLPWSRPGDPPIGVAGFFTPDAQGVFETAMAATVLPLLDDIDPNTFLPSSRSVAFTRSAWAAAGGYPEWLDYSEDLVYDLKLNALRTRRASAFDWSPGALVSFKPRTSLSAFWTQYYRYARGDGKADLWRKRHAIRYATYGVALPALLGHALWGVFARWLGWLGLIAGIVLYCRRPFARLMRLRSGLSTPETLRAAALIPIIRVVGDVAKMCGYPVGVLWRLRNRRRAELDWRADIARRRRRQVP